MIQKFLPEVSDGDKRIILVDGEFAGAVNRVPAADDLRSNMVRGGSPKETELTPREREICETLGPALRERGLLFVGIDVIGGWLTEINVTSPTGIRAIKNARRAGRRGADLGQDRGSGSADRGIRASSKPRHLSSDLPAASCALARRRDPRLTSGGIAISLANSGRGAELLLPGEHVRMQPRERIAGRATAGWRR